jgi:hypothetical protein
MEIIINLSMTGTSSVEDSLQSAVLLGNVAIR